MLIRVENLSKRFIVKGEKELSILSDVNLEIGENEFICIIGPSGCGKTVLLDLLAGFDKPTSGCIYINDKLVEKPSPHHVTIFQDYKLLPWRTVRKNVEFAFEGVFNKLSRKEIADIVSKQLESVGLKDFEDYRPSEISGGMKQRVAIARALAVDPNILFMDEPFGALDSLTKMSLQDKIVSLLDNSGKTVIFVTHSIDEAIFLADKIVLMGYAPESVKEIIDISLKKPRNRGDKEFIEISDYITGQLKDIYYQKHKD